MYCSVYDEFEILNNNFVEMKKKGVETVEGDVIITRNPCLHPADIRKLKCIGAEEAKFRFLNRGFD